MPGPPARSCLWGRQASLSLSCPQEAAKDRTAASNKAAYHVGKAADHNSNRQNVLLGVHQTQVGHQLEEGGSGWATELTQATVYMAFKTY